MRPDSAGRSLRAVLLALGAIAVLSACSTLAANAARDAAAEQAGAAPVAPAPSLTSAPWSSAAPDQPAASLTTEPWSSADPAPVMSPPPVGYACPFIPAPMPLPSTDPVPGTKSNDPGNVTSTPGSEPGGSGGGASGSGGTSTDPGQPVWSCPPGPIVVQPFPDDGATHVTPTPGIVDAHPVAIDHVTVAADGTTVTLYWWGGTRDCYGLAGVTVSYDATGVPTFTIMEGTLPDLGKVACDDIAMLLATDVTLDHPLFHDGSGN